MTSKTTWTWVNFFSLIATIILLSTIINFKCRMTQTSIILTIIVAISIVHIIIVAIVDVITNVTILVILAVVIAMILMISIVSNVFFITLALLSKPTCILTSGLTRCLLFPISTSVTPKALCACTQILGRFTLSF